MDRNKITVMRFANAMEALTRGLRKHYLLQEARSVQKAFDENTDYKKEIEMLDRLSHLHRRMAGGLNRDDLEALREHNRILGVGGGSKSIWKSWKS